MRTGAQVLFKALEAQGVEVVFGLPGGTIMPVYDALIDSPIRHILMRHEQGAGHAAEGFAHTTGRPGVCFATSGPGACNLVTALSDAMMDSIPMVAITGQVARPGIGKQAFQEAPVTAITATITKKNWLVMDPDDIGDVVQEAFDLATSGRPGPVLIDIPKDVQLAPARWSGPQARAAANTPIPSVAAFEQAVDLIRAARRPVLYVGGGAVKAEAWLQVRELAEANDIPAVTTLMARGVLPDSHPLCFGMPGMHGSYTAVTAMQRADLLLCVGARFDDRVTGRLDGFAPEAKVVHIDVDPREINKNRAADVALIGDAKLVLTRLNGMLSKHPERGRPDRLEWLGTLRQWEERYPNAYQQDDCGPLKAQHVIERLHAACGGHAVLTAGVGQHQMWASQFWGFERPRAWATSGGAGTMGFAIPAALGAKVAHPDELVMAIDGDGCFQMTCQELATSVAEHLPILVAVINNGHLGMVRQWQELYHDKRRSQVYLGFESPDYVRLAEAYGCLGLRASNPADLDEVIGRGMREARERTVVIDFRVDEREMCYPIVEAGRTNDEIDLGPVIGRRAFRPEQLEAAL